MSWLDELESSKTFDTLTGIGKAYANAKLTPGALSGVGVTQATDGSVHANDGKAAVAATNAYASTIPQAQPSGSSGGVSLVVVVLVVVAGVVAVLALRK